MAKISSEKPRQKTDKWQASPAICRGRERQLRNQLQAIRETANEGDVKAAREMSEVFLSDAYDFLTSEVPDVILLDVEEMINELLHEVFPQLGLIQRRGNSSVISHQFEEL